jgi:hypothetical protein
MNELTKWIFSALVIPLAIGLGGAAIGGEIKLATVFERIEAVKVSVSVADAKAEEAKASAQEAHRRINFFHGGG